MKLWSLLFKLGLIGFLVPVLWILSCVITGNGLPPQVLIVQACSAALVWISLIFLPTAKRLPDEDSSNWGHLDQADLDAKASELTTLWISEFEQKHG